MPSFHKKHVGMLLESPIGTDVHVRAETAVEGPRLGKHRFAVPRRGSEIQTQVKSHFGGCLPLCHSRHEELLVPDKAKKQNEERGSNVGKKL